MALYTIAYKLMLQVHRNLCVCVCVHLFLPETEDTNQRIKIKSRTTPQPWTVLDSPRLEKWCKRMQMHVDTRVKKKKK